MNAGSPSCRSHWRIWRKRSSSPHPRDKREVLARGRPALAAKPHHGLGRGVTPLARLAVTILLAVVAARGAAAETPYRERVQHDFEAWLGTNIWPEAKTAGVSRGTFDRSLSGITLDWSMPELEPPGVPVKPPTIEWQAQFGSPGNYFNERTLSNLARLGRGSASTHGARRWAASPSATASRRAYWWRSGPGIPSRLCEAARADICAPSPRRPSWGGARICFDRS